MNDIKNTYLKRILRDGAASLSDKELIEFVLSFSSAESDAADCLFSQYDSLRGILDRDIYALMHSRGMTDAAAILLKLIPALCQGSLIAVSDVKYISDTDSAKKYFKNYFTGITRENFTAVILKKNLKILNVVRLRSGTRSGVSINFRDIVKFSSESEEQLVIIAHNHPDGDAEPSRSDILSTKKLITSLRAVDMTLIDHIIIGRSSAASLRELDLPDLRFDDVKGYSIV